MSAWPETLVEVDALRDAWTRADWDALTPALLAIGAHCLRGARLSDDDRDDLLARAMLRAWAQETVPEHPAAWMFRVLRNAMLDHAKHQRFVAPWSADAIDTLVSQTPPADVALIDEEERERVLTTLRRALRTLPDPVRRCVVLRYLHHRSHAEIAQQLHVSPSAVKGRIHRGLHALRAYYATATPYDDLTIHARRDAAGLT